jgi:hypothetical protein
MIQFLECAPQGRPATEKRRAYGRTCAFVSRSITVIAFAKSSQVPNRA